MLSLLAEAERMRIEVGDAVIAASCLVAADAIRSSDLLAGFGPFEPSSDVYLSATIAGLASTQALRWTRSDSESDGFRLGSLVRGCAVGASLLALLGLAFGLEGLSVTLLAVFAPLYLASLVGWRALVTRARRWVRRRGRQRSSIVIGSNQRARDVAGRLSSEWGFRNLGFLDDSPVSLDVEAIGAQYLGSSKELERLIEEETVDEVVIALPREQLTSDPTLAAIRLCERVGVDVTISSELFDTQHAELRPHRSLGMPALTYRSHALPPLWALGVKRAIDLFGAAAVIVLSAPVWIAAAIAIKLDSRGPVLFIQPRSGLYGRVFPFVKFRTMEIDAEKKLESLRDRNEMSGPVFKIKADPRVTRVGRFLRKYSIDEMPQLFNVLQGHMSLVGPRPPTPNEVVHYETFQRRRLSLRPGLTGLWQVSGRNLLDFDEWIRLDLKYIDEWSLWLDLKILLRTIPTVLTGRGAS